MCMPYAMISTQIIHSSVTQLIIHHLTSEHHRDACCAPADTNVHWAHYARHIQPISYPIHGINHCII